MRATLHTVWNQIRATALRPSDTRQKALSKKYSQEEREIHMRKPREARACWQFSRVDRVRQNVGALELAGVVVAGVVAGPRL